MKVIKTLDGSHTIFVSELDEPYHSVNGAIQESMHVFINANLKLHNKEKLSVFELGFGTGLNTILTYKTAIEKDLSINYTSIEKYPVPIEIIEQLNYLDFLNDDQARVFLQIHETEWNKEKIINDNFTIKKIKCDILDYNHQNMYDAIFFDAFDPEKQPQLWSEDVFEKLYKNTNRNGILTTYSAKGKVRRAMLSAGYKIEKIPGPPGKREMLRGVKVIN